MNGIDDADWTETLIAYANGTLDPSARAETEAALAGSAELRGELAEIELLRRSVRSEQPPATIPEEVFARLDTPSTANSGAPPGNRSSVQPPPTADAPVPLAPTRRRRPRWMPTLGAVAAAVIAVTAGFVVLRRGGDEAGPQVTGTPGPSAQPTDAFQARPIQALRGTVAAMRSARTATLDVSGTGTATLDGSLFGESGGETEVVVDISGDGAVDLGDGSPNSTAYRLTTTIVGVSGPPSLRPDRSTSETIVLDGRRYSSDDGGPHSEEPVGDGPADSGLFASIVFSPDVLARLPDLAVGDIEDLGREELAGVEVRHLHLELESGSIGEKDARDEADVWLDEAGIVRKLRFTSAGPLELPLSADGTVSLTLEIELQDLGEPVDIDKPG